ncbi:MAG: hypothetical protein SPI24_07450 [Bacteroidales bacterium]|nr:hypothetical protein [Bacteroidales bacterium]MDY6075544.1 hypothetical protein [Bacteroidales bacterium]
MIKLIKKIIFAWKYKHSIRKAKRLSKLTGKKYYVILLNGGLKVVPKKTIKELISKKRFRKGTSIQDIEKRALFITK